MNRRMRQGAKTRLSLSVAAIEGEQRYLWGKRPFGASENCPILRTFLLLGNPDEIHNAV